MDILSKKKGGESTNVLSRHPGCHYRRTAATTELLQLLIRRNDLHAEDVASAIFTVTEDLDAEFPALAARYLGWTEVALMCTREIPVPGSLEKCIRILLHVNTTRSAAEIQHVYTRGAVNLRPTLNEKR